MNQTFLKFQQNRFWNDFSCSLTRKKSIQLTLIKMAPVKNNIHLLRTKMESSVIVCENFILLKHRLMQTVLIAPIS